jgi:hypothetical protein
MAGCRCRDVLDLGRVDVHAARDDHVALAVADVDEPLGVDPGHVADGHPLSARGLRGRGRVLVVLVEDAVVAPDEQLARRAGRPRPALVVEHGDLDAGGGAAAGTRLAQHVLRTEHGVDTELRGAVELVEHRTEHLDDLLLHAHRAGGGGDDDRPHRPHVVARAHGGRQVDDALEQRGRHERRRAPVALDLAQGVLRIELAHHDHRAPDHVRVEREAARRRVVERTRDQVDVRGVQAVEGAEARQHGGRVGHAAPGALRLARRARRVNHRAAHRRRRGRRLAAAAQHEVLERLRPGATLRAHRDPAPHAGGRGADALGHGQERLADEDRRRVGVLEDVGHLLGGEAVVHRHRDGAEGAEGGGGDDVVGRVLGVDDRVLPRAHAEGRQGVCEPVPHMEKLSPRQRALALDEGGPVRLRCCIPGDQVHWGESLPGCWPVSCKIL